MVDAHRPPQRRPKRHGQGRRDGASRAAPAAATTPRGRHRKRRRRRPPTPSVCVQPRPAGAKLTVFAVACGGDRGVRL